ncbi:MAG: Rpp14/Pop5 family protein [Candidatus Hodarchaeales archaeon]|jgi:RNase P/RNase MRP subunit POP5
MTKIKLERPRYFIVNYLHRRKLDERELWNVLSSTAFKLFGLKGVSEMGMYITSNHEFEPFFIIRVAHEHVDKLHAVLCAITQYEGQPITCRTILKTGTVKKAQEIVERKIKTVMKPL